MLATLAGCNGTMLSKSNLRFKTRSVGLVEGEASCAVPERILYVFLRQRTFTAALMVIKSTTIARSATAGCLHRVVAGHESLDSWSCQASTWDTLSVSDLLSELLEHPSFSTCFSLGLRLCLCFSAKTGTTFGISFNIGLTKHVQNIISIELVVGVVLDYNSIGHVCNCGRHHNSAAEQTKSHINFSFSIITLNL